MPKIVDRDQYRKTLLSQCFHLIAEKGYASITMRQIAQGLGVSTGTLYHYFPSKEQLFEQLVEHIASQNTAAPTVAHLNSAPTLQGKVESLLEFIAQNEDYFLNQTLMLMDFCRHHSREEVSQNQILKATGERYEQTIAQAWGIADVAVVQLVLHCIEGLLVRRLYQGDRISIQEQSRLLGAMMQAYLSETDRFSDSAKASKSPDRVEIKPSE